MTDGHQSMRRQGISGHDDGAVRLHRRTVRLDGRDYTVLGLRPGTTERFAVNRFHETWHVVTHTAGARLLGRLLWGMAYQRRPNTIVVVDRPFLDANPFDAEPSLPIVIAPGDTAPFGDRAARELRRMLPLTGRPSEGGVTLRAHGLPSTPEAAHAWFDGRHREWHGWKQRRFRPTIEVRSGLLVLPGTARKLQEWAVEIGRLTATHQRPMDYEFVNEDYSLEVQVFAAYRDMVTAARLAREQVVNEPRPIPAPVPRATPGGDAGRKPGRTVGAERAVAARADEQAAREPAPAPHAPPLDPAELNLLVWERSDRVHRRMRLNRTKRYTRKASSGRGASSSPSSSPSSSSS
ncbi:hypothetical protein [Yinghuangia seranimata]|uniref:hypothetical protein n=1 Tax=Yinghuangia seranimata TaxID=408067 RepID=UPI00248B313C|nr:hypothetical protein [Yinghuangia seranimata]MDI2126712.1 hypothetical protein [Yinghuangia seranimata]